jgi:hypothetical protein
VPSGTGLPGRGPLFPGPSSTSSPGLQIGLSLAISITSLVATQQDPISRRYADALSRHRDPSGWLALPLMGVTPLRSASASNRPYGARLLHDHPLVGDDPAVCVSQDSMSPFNQAAPCCEPSFWTRRLSAAPWIA